MNVTGIFSVHLSVRIVRTDRFHSNMASARRSQLFPKIKSSSFESRTCTEVGNFNLFIMIGRSSVIPKDRVRSPFAVTTINRDGRSIEHPKRLSKGIVMMLVAAPLSTMAWTT